MDQFETEEQQVEAIKRFWKENGMAIIAGAVIGLGGLYGWRYYTDSQIATKEQASIDYQTAVEAIADDESANSLQAFVDGSDVNGYKSISAFVLAKQHVDNNELDKAAGLLEDILLSEKATPLSAVAALRLATIQQQQGQYDAVISTLSKVETEAFQAQVLALKGDALSALTRFDEARQAYMAALEKAPQDVQVKMKLDNLAVSAGA